MASTRWNLVVSSDTDVTLRQFLASRGGGRKGDLSRFVEDAVRAHVLELSASEAKAKNSRRRAKEIEGAIDEALDWARRR
ncbi:MAG TPA: ribbon-helix-helix domain-containing protein [Edaphobacter sp.]|jgi:hypothetical protein|nr:ribbon-helix-helix domain-containing protein [Edaphobacter sp.]